MWRLGLLLTLVAGWCLASVITSIVRGRDLPPNDARRPRTACLVAAAIVAALAFAVAVYAMLVDLGAFGKPELPIASAISTALVGGLAALAQALRLVAVPAGARSENEGFLLFLMSALALAVTCCYGVLLGSR